METFIKRGRMKTTATRKINIYQKVFIFLRLIRYPDPLKLPFFFAIGDCSPCEVKTSSSGS